MGPTGPCKQPEGRVALLMSQSQPTSTFGQILTYRGVLVAFGMLAGYAYTGSIGAIAAGAGVALLLDLWVHQSRTSAANVPQTIIESAVDHLPGVFFVVNPDLRIRRWSDGYRNVSGYIPSSVEEEDIETVFVPEDQDRVGEMFRRILRNGSERFEADLRTEDGRRIPMQITGTRISNRVDTCIVGTGISVLEKRRTETQLEHQERQYRLLAENISDVVTLHDAEGRRLYVSPSSVDLIGKTPEQLFGTLPFDDMHPLDAARVRDVFMFAQEGDGEVRAEYRIRHADGHYKWVESTGRTTSNTGGEASLIVVTRDVSVRKRREKDLVDSRERLSLQKRRLRLLYNVISQQDRPTDEQLQRVLDLGTDLLGVDVGIISRISDDEFTIEASTAGGVFDPGRTYPLADTYSAITIEQEEALALAHVGASDYADAACYRRFGLDQYLGAAIRVDDELYGTLSFASQRPRTRPFTDEDREFLQTLVQWIRAALKGRTQERALADSQRLLEKTEEVSNVGGWVYEDVTDSFTHTDNLSAIFEVPDDYVFHPDDGPRFFGDEAWTRLLRHVYQAYEQATPFDIAVPATTGRGNQRWLRVSCEAERDGNRAGRIWGTVQDITDRREVEDELRVTAQRLEALLASLHEGVLVEDPSRTVRLVNEPFCQLFDLDQSPEELIGTSSPDVAIAATSVIADAGETLDRLREIMMSRSSTIGERVELLDGRVLECDYIPIQIDGTRFGHLWKYRDVTVREEREAKLRSAKEAADEARNEAERAERLKSIFLANMSHEIRTPLTSIIGFAEVLEDEVPEPYDHLAELVGTSGRRLLNTISSVLDLSKLEANRWQVDVETINVASEIEEAMQVYRPRAEDRSIDLQLDLQDHVPLIARADYAALQRILDNLVGNALKFTPEEGRVALRAGVSGKSVRICIEDTGPGIDPDMLDQLFEPFVGSPDERSESASGSGLGLAITRRLVTAMRGTITLDDSYTDGARFIVDLPRPAGMVDQQARLPVSTQTMAPLTDPRAADADPVELEPLSASPNGLSHRPPGSDSASPSGRRSSSRAPSQNGSEEDGPEENRSEENGSGQNGTSQNGRHRQTSRPDSSGGASSAEGSSRSGSPDRGDTSSPASLRSRSGADPQTSGDGSSSPLPPSSSRRPEDTEADEDDTLEMHRTSWDDGRETRPGESESSED